MTFKPRSYDEALEKKRERDKRKRERLLNQANKEPEPKQWTSTTKKRKPLRSKRDPKLTAWSKAVRERDEYTCQWPKPGGCRTGDSRIEAHHIAERSLRPDLRYVLENGVALCSTHHAWLPLHRQEAIQLGLLSEETYEKSMKEQRNLGLD